MDILFITGSYPTNKYKTSGIFAFDQAKALVKQGHNVIFAAVDLRSIRRWRKWGIERRNIDGVEVYAINIPLGRISKNMLRKFRFLGLRILYKRIIEDHGIPDIMHAHFTGSAYSASKLKDVTGIPLVVTEHSSKINTNNMDEGLYKIASEAYKKADSLIAVSPSLAKMINKHFDIKPTYIPNIADLDVFKYSDKKNSNSFNFVSTGNLINTKRMDLTIEAFYEAFGNNPRVMLSIFGQGPKRRMLEDLINNYNLNSQVKLMGLCSREEIAKQLGKSDCFVLASQSETFGVAYIEALAMGVPVIATRCGGPEEFVNDNNGLMIDVNNKKQLANAMKYMYNNVDKYDRRTIAEEISEKFSPRAVANKIIGIYDEILGKKQKCK